MIKSNETSDANDIRIKQYNIKQVVTLWLLAAVPMGVFGWIVTPIMAKATNIDASIMRIIMMTLGLIWQFILVLILLRKERGSLKSFSKRLWLQHPTNPVTKRIDKRMYLFTIPLLALSALSSLVISPNFDALFTKIFPFLKQPDSMNIELFIEGSKSQLVGAWWFLGLFFIMSLFNTFLGEELLFRGVLLPRVNRLFKKYDWLVVGILFGIYHLAMPWSIFSAMISSSLLLCLPTKLFKSSWFGIIVHSGQSMFFFFIFLGLVMGWA